MLIPELVAPAGNLEKLKTALRYGADAVYCGGKEFSLRAHAGNLTLAEITEGVALTHAEGKRIFVAINIFAHNNDMDRLPEYVAQVRDAGVDAVIVSDPGVLDTVREIAPNMAIHLSTQANTTNIRSLGFWKRQGVTRTVIAREMSADDMKRMGREGGMELEMFVHGAMCISYSGRCYISDYLTGRSANHGDCTHPCRWQYRVEEEQRPGKYYSVEEDGRGTYFMNSKDLCLIDHIPLIVSAGVRAIKIEGRMKGLHYAASVIRTYRAALDAYAENPEAFTVTPEWRRELTLASHREYTTGFFNGKPDSSAYRADEGGYVHGADFVGRIVEAGDTDAVVEIRNGFNAGDALEVVRPTFKDDFTQVINSMITLKGVSLERANPNTLLRIPFMKEVKPGDLLRKPVKISS